MLFGGSVLIAHPTADYVGTDVSEHPNDTFLQSVASIVAAGGTSDVKSIKGGDGKTYYVTFDAVEGTD